MSIINRFEVAALDEQVNWLNEFLAKFLNANSEIRQELDRYYNHCPVNDYDDGIKKFNLEKWCGGDVNPTLEIVQIKGELKFATTHYGVLGPLSKVDCNRPIIKEVIMNFFINPSKYFNKGEKRSLEIS